MHRHDGAFVDEKLDLGDIYLIEAKIVLFLPKCEPIYLIHLPNCNNLPSGISTFGMWIRDSTPFYLIVHNIVNLLPSCCQIYLVDLPNGYHFT